MWMIEKYLVNKTTLWHKNTELQYTYITHAYYMSNNFSLQDIS